MNAGGFRSLGLRDAYRSDTSDLARDFYGPVMSVAASYDRAVGYFNGRGLAAAAAGLDAFVERDGRIRLVASAELAVEDIKEMQAGYAVREVIAQRVIMDLEDALRETGCLSDRLGLVGRLIAKNRLDVKIAFAAGSRGPALYHEKSGVLYDAAGDTVVFFGSANETGAAYHDNFEAIETFCSWIAADRHRVERFERRFDDLWHARTARLTVIDFPQVAADMLVAHAARTGRHSIVQVINSPLPEMIHQEDEAEVPDGWATRPPDIEARDYQKQAVEGWLAASARGCLRMATATGKTITALTAADQLGRQLRARGVPLVTVIVVPLLDLGVQWTAALRRFGVTPIACMEDSKAWRDAAHTALAGLRAARQGSITFITTNATFVLSPFQKLLSQIDLPLLLIADEMHAMGAERTRTLLPEHAQFRLGLSATPERWMDQEGTDALAAYFGPTVIDLGIPEAIRLGALTPYTYHPVIVELEADETAEYVQLTRKIGAAFGRGGKAQLSDPGSPLNALMRRRAGVLGHAAGKIPALRAEAAKRRDRSHQLVYCAPGSRPGGGERQLEAAMRVIGNDLGLAAHPYTSQESSAARRALLDAFTTGRDLRALVAMRCLDEGVDLPDARVAYLLASSRNPRQFIQRRGRILRRAPGKSCAEVVDFVVAPPPDPDLFHIERTLFGNELARCVEFAEHADNHAQAAAVLRPLAEYYQIFDL